MNNFDGFNLVQPGTWINLETNLSINYNDYTKEDVVKSPVFIMTREGSGNNLKAMLLDQRYNLLIWYINSEPRFKHGTIAGHIEKQSFHATILDVSFNNIKLTSQTKAIYNTALERRSKFLKNCPEMENEFFKVEGNIEEKVPEKIIDNRCICPITFEPFKDPVTAPDGRNYEREAIVTWLRNHGTSPITREPMKEEQLITNFALQPESQ